MFTGDDGQSHFEDVQIELGDAGAAGSISRLWPGRGVQFRTVDGNYLIDFHNAPRRQLVVNLTGSVEIEVGDGTKRLLGQKVLVTLPNPEGGPSTKFVVRVLWTCSVGDDLFENGGNFLEVPQ